MGWLKTILGVAALEEAGIKIGTQVSTVKACRDADWFEINSSMRILRQDVEKLEARVNWAGTVSGEALITALNHAAAEEVGKELRQSRRYDFVSLPEILSIEEVEFENTVTWVED